MIRLQSERNSRSGMSLVELMIGISIFMIVVLSVGGVHQRVSKNIQATRLAQKAVEFSKAEVTRLNRMSRLPERNVGGELVYRNEQGTLVASGGQLVPYGYATYLTPSALGGSQGEIVTYPDVLSDQLEGTSNLDRVQLRRRFSITTVNEGLEDEYKQIQITLSDTQTPPRFKEIQQTLALKKPHPSALDTRVARGTADLTGKIVDKITRMPITPGGSVVVTLTPSDATPSRYVTADAKGRFYFSPPLNTDIGYTASFAYPGMYWTKTVPVELSPGSNSIQGPSGDTVQLAPLAFAQAEFIVYDAETGVPLDNARVQVFHNGTAPNSRPSSYSNKYTDSSGRASYTIEIPEPDQQTYESYYLYRIEKTGYIRIENPVDRFLRLDSRIPVTRTYRPYRIKTGQLNVVVRTPEGAPHPKAQVELFSQSNYTTLLNTGQTDSSGRASFTGLVVNTVANPTATVQRIYVQVRAANHRRVLSYVDVVADDVRQLDVPLQAHRVYWEETSVNRIQVQKGFTRDATARLYYEGHRGPGYNNVALGPTQSALLGESVTAGGTPGTWEWSGYDANLISILQHPNAPDTITVTGREVGTTQLNLTATYRFSWNGTPYTLEESRSYNVEITAAGVGTLSAGIYPNLTIMGPNASQTFQAVPSQRPYDLTYTWDITGDGVASVEYLTASGQSTTNGGTSAVFTRVRAGTRIGSSILVGLTVRSDSLDLSADQLSTIEVNYMPLGVSINPAGPLNTQPGYTSGLTAVPSGGSGHYQFEWTLLDPGTGAMAAPELGTLSNTSQQSTTFTPAQVSNVNVNVKMTDTTSGEYREATLLVQTLPPGGVSQ